MMNFLWRLLGWLGWAVLAVVVAYIVICYLAGIVLAVIFGLALLGGITSGD